MYGLQFCQQAVFPKRHNQKFLDHVEINQYPKLEIDARIVIFYKYFFGEYNLIKKN